MTGHAAKEARRVSGGEGEHGHLEEFRTDPIALMQRVRDECGDVGYFQLAGKKVVLLTGAEANEFFFRATDDDLDQAEAYPFMTPIFGTGVVFDAFSEAGLDAGIRRALALYRRRSEWKAVQRTAMAQRHDWAEAAQQYLAVYRQALAS